MSKKSFVKLSEEELLEKIDRSEKYERKLMVLGIDGLYIGLIGTVIFVLLGIVGLAVIFGAMAVVGFILDEMSTHSRKKTESQVNEYMHDFYEAELENAFGPP